MNHHTKAKRQQHSHYGHILIVVVIVRIYFDCVLLKIYILVKKHYAMAARSDTSQFHWLDHVEGIGTSAIVVDKLGRERCVTDPTTIIMASTAI